MRQDNYSTKNIQKVSKPLLNIYVKQDFIVEGIRPIPLLMHMTSDDHRVNLLYWNKLRTELRNNIQISYFNNLDEAIGVIVIPHYLNDYKNRVTNVMSFCKEAREKGKYVIVFHDGIHNVYAHLFSIQFKLNNTNSAHSTVSIPAWLYELPHDRNYRVGKVPKIGFTGNTNYPSKLNLFARYIPLSNSIINTLGSNLLIDMKVNLRVKQVIARYVRQTLAKYIKQFTEVDCNLIERDGPFFNLSTDEKEKRRLEYRNNIYNNLYTIVIRGDQNGCFQLYEVMSAGRIPIIIDTNIALPRLKSIKWEDFSLIVPFKKLNDLEQYILHFHNSHAEQELIDMCEMARAAYEELLPHNYVFNVIIPEIQKLNDTVKYDLCYDQI